MIKKSAVLLSVFLVLWFAVYRLNNRIFLKKDDNTVIYNLNGRQYRLLKADQAKEWNKGLMFYTKPVKFDGMIFIFPDKKRRSFWNKNTYLDLNIYWIDNDKVVGKTFLPSVKKSKKIVVVESRLPINRVIELIK